MANARVLWSGSSETLYLLTGVATLLALALGAGQFWGQNRRWVVTAHKMIRSGEYRHP